MSGTSRKTWGVVYGSWLTCLPQNLKIFLYQGKNKFSYSCFYVKECLETSITKLHQEVSKNGFTSTENDPYHIIKIKYKNLVKN